MPLNKETKPKVILELGYELIDQQLRLHTHTYTHVCVCV